MPHRKERAAKMRGEKPCRFRRENDSGHIHDDFGRQENETKDFIGITRYACFFFDARRASCGTSRRFG